MRGTSMRDFVTVVIDAAYEFFEAPRLLYCYYRMAANTMSRWQERVSGVDL